MKTITKFFQKYIVLMMLINGLVSNHSVQAQATEAQQLTLNVQKLFQLKQILENMYKGYKILDKGYTTIKNIAEGNYSIHQLFLDGLFAVNPTIRNYRRIPMIIEHQKLLVKEYQRAYIRFKQDPHFTPQELEYLLNVYNYLIDASLRNIDRLMMVITATKLRMSDDERLQAIDTIFFDMEDKLFFLRSFNNSTQLLAIQRARSSGDIATLRKLYDIN